MGTYPAFSVGVWIWTTRQ